MPKILILFISLFVATDHLRSEQDIDSVTVYIFMAEECRICQYYTPLLRNLYEGYNDHNISFTGLFPNRHSSIETITKFKDEYDIPFPLKYEYFQTLTRKFEVRMTPEVVVYNESEKKIIYKGRIDNSYYRVGRKRRVITNHELKDVLERIQDGNYEPLPSKQPVGCFISLN
ncbi:MAG: redoxin domain-containing protein [Saprospiraceae bacterium]|nr:redoxin domain-containing protein [Bacteroidia bacterium]NNF22031.1 redoxin domain-containing protein [Saprospiraceae bacterium]NNK90596.1 redoxin domain-containing protein [Saprospiraceae bacterium]